MDFIRATQNSVHEVGLLVPRSSIVSVGRTPGEHEPCVCPAPATRRSLSKPSQAQTHSVEDIEDEDGETLSDRVFRVLDGASVTVWTEKDTWTLNVIVQNCTKGVERIHLAANQIQRSLRD